MPIALAFFGAPGPVELTIIALLALLFFGNRLPSVMRSLGIGITEFKKGIRDGDVENNKIEEQKAKPEPEKEHVEQ